MGISHGLPARVACARTGGWPMSGSGQPSKDRVGETLPIDAQAQIGQDDATIRTDRAADPWIGRVLKGKYRLERALGSGGFGTVYAARQLLTDTWHAVKLMHSPMASQPHMRERLRDEARTGMQLHHSRIVRITDFDIEGEAFFLVMDMIDSRTLAERLRAKPSDLTLHLPTWARDIAAALDYAHSRGVLHRDLKPSNVLVREQDDAALLTDFGISRWMHQAGLTADGVTLGTYSYMSPEQCRGEERTIDARSDIYAFAAVLFEAVAGRPPFGSGPEAMQGHLHRGPPRLMELSPGLPYVAALDRAFGRGLAKSPNQRPGSAEELAEEFIGALSGASPTRPGQEQLIPTISPPPGSPPPPGAEPRVASLWATIRRNRVPVAMAAVAFIVLLSGAIAIAQSRPPARTANVAGATASAARGQATAQPSALTSLPAAALGTWIGSAHVFSESGDHALKVTLRGGSIGDVVGDYDFPSVSNCRGVLLLERASTGSSDLTPQPNPGLVSGADECAAKRIVITPSNGVLNWKTYESAGSPLAGQASLVQGGPQIALPAADVGTWKGSVNVFSSGSYALVATIRSGQIGDVVGEYSYPGITPTCGGVLVLDAVTGGSSALTQQPASGLTSGEPECVGARIIIAASGGTLDWKLYDAQQGNPQGQGSLAKTS